MPRSIAVCSDRNLWVALTSGGALVRLTTNCAVERYARPGASTSAIAAGFGKLWVVNANAGAIARVVPRWDFEAPSPV